MFFLLFADFIMKEGVSMDKQLQKQQKKLEKKEVRLLQIKQKRYAKLDNWLDNMEEKIPPALKKTLDAAFFKGFQVVFEKGGGIIEKTYAKDKLKLAHEINDFAVSRKLAKKGLRNMDGQAFQSHAFNSCAAFAEGAGLGLLGIGLPDIPLFIGMLLKGIYETALSYGFEYENDEEKIWILLLIKTALSNNEQKIAFHKEVEDMRVVLSEKKAVLYDLQQQMQDTASVLSEAMLFLKFVQGFPIVGIVGSIGNFSIYQKVSKYANVQYKMRYIYLQNVSNNLQIL